ncbi:ORC/CDC6 like AAA+ ATPase [Cryptosporidium canis]|nr:ORC/CDC6 like AAA+ ATPase [Cryptosporidium canis]
MAIVDRKISSFELRQSTRSKLLSSKLVESKSIVKKARRKSERRYFTNTDYLNSQDGASPSDSPSKSSKRRKTERDTAVRGVSTRRSKGKVVSSETDGRESESDWLERVHGMRRSPIVTSQGYHLYTHLIIESKDERDVFTVGDHVMVCLSGGGERPAQITAFLYDPEEDLQGVELRWFYSEHDLLDLVRGPGGQRDQEDDPHLEREEGIPAVVEGLSGHLQRAPEMQARGEAVGEQTPR